MDYKNLEKRVENKALKIIIFYQFSVVAKNDQ